MTGQLTDMASFLNATSRIKNITAEKNTLFLMPMYRPTIPPDSITMPD
jgi:hypothetical protein